MGVPRPFLSQLIQMRRNRMRITVASQMRTDILRRKPKNVGPIRSLQQARGEQEDREKRFHEFTNHPCGMVWRGGCVD